MVFTLVFTAALGAFFFGYNMGDLNPLQNYLQNTVYREQMGDETDLYIGMIGAFVSAGAIPGAVLGGKFANQFGRKNAMIVTDFIGLIGVALTLIDQLSFLLVGRIICGFAVGLNSSIVPLFINEVSPIELNGITGSMNQVWICIGVLTSYLTGYFVPFTTSAEPGEPEIIWQIIFTVPGITAALRILLLTFVFPYDTPRYLVLKGDEDKARQILAKIYSPDLANEQLMLLKKEREAETMAGNKLTFKDLLSPKYSRRLLVGCGLSVLQQLSGINALITFSNQVFLGDQSDASNQTFDQLQTASETARTYTVLFGVINLVTPLVTGFIANKVGRKTLLITGDIVCMVCLVLFPIPGLPTIIQKASVFVYSIGFGFSLGPIVWLYIPEVLPDIGIGIAVLANWVTATIVVQTFTILYAALGNYSFWIFFGFCLVGLLFLIVFVKETKDKTPLEIENMYLPPGYKDSTLGTQLLKGEIDQM